VLELGLLLDHLWKDTGLIAYSVGFLNNVSGSVADFAKSQVEWMNEKIARSFAEDRYNPFNFKHVKLCDSIEEINKLSSPKLILASAPDMECGFSRDLFLEWSSDEKNLILFTKRPAINMLARLVIDSQDKVVTVKV
jgi:cleavage and polyadenylation specificity factor subunit 2